VTQLIVSLLGFFLTLVLIKLAQQVFVCVNGIAKISGRRKQFSLSFLTARHRRNLNLASVFQDDKVAFCPSEVGCVKGRDCPPPEVSPARWDQSCTSHFKSYSTEKCEVSNCPKVEMHGPKMLQDFDRSSQFSLSYQLRTTPDASISYRKITINLSDASIFPALTSARTDLILVLHSE
jgi:hypothetical protein